MKYLYYKEAVNQMRIKQPDGTETVANISTPISSDHPAFCHAMFYVQTPIELERYERGEVDYCFRLTLRDGTTLEIPMTKERINEIKDSLDIPEAIEFLKLLPINNE